MISLFPLSLDFKLTFARSSRGCGNCLNQIHLGSPPGAERTLQF